MDKTVLKPLVHSHGTSVYITGGRLDLDEIEQFLKDLMRNARIAGYIRPDEFTTTENNYVRSLND